MEDELVAMLPRLRRMARALCRREEEVDDLVQGTCERALRGRSGFLAGTRFDSWLFRIMQNLWLDRVARERRCGERLALEEAREVMGADGARAVEAHLTLAAVRRLVRALPPEQRLALVLVALEGLSYREAAERMGVPLGTLMSRLGRARRRLVELLEGEAAEEDRR